MNTKSATPAQAEAQDAVSLLRPATEIAEQTDAVARAIAEAKRESRLKRLTAAAMWTELYLALCADSPEIKYPDTLGPATHKVVCNNADYIVELNAKIRNPWQPMSSAPAGDVTACVDIWSGEEDRRITDCFWEADLGAWACEVFADSGEYRVIRVPDPVAWMPAPVKPEPFRD